MSLPVIIVVVQSLSQVCFVWLFVCFSIIFFLDVSSSFFCVLLIVFEVSTTTSDLLNSIFFIFQQQKIINTYAFASPQSWLPCL